MKPDHNTLREAGEALFGSHWHTLLGQELKVADRTIRRWAAGEFEIPSGVWPELAKLCKARGKALDRLAAKLAG